MQQRQHALNVFHRHRFLFQEAGFPAAIFPGSWITRIFREAKAAVAAAAMMTVATGIFGTMVILRVALLTLDQVAAIRAATAVGTGGMTALSGDGAPDGGDIPIPFRQEEEVKAEENAEIQVLPMAVLSSPIEQKLEDAA